MTFFNSVDLVLPSGQQQSLGAVSKIAPLTLLAIAIWTGDASANWTNNNFMVAPGTTATNNFFTNNAGFVNSSFQTNIPGNCSGTINVTNPGSRFVQFFLGNDTIFSSNGGGSRNFNIPSSVTGLSSAVALAGAGSVDIDISITCQGAPPPTTPPATTTPPTTTTPSTTSTSTAPSTPTTNQGETDAERAAREERERLEREEQARLEQEERERQEREAAEREESQNFEDQSNNWLNEITGNNFPAAVEPDILQFDEDGEPLPWNPLIDRFDPGAVNPGEDPNAGAGPQNNPNPDVEFGEDGPREIPENGGDGRTGTRIIEDDGQNPPQVIAGQPRPGNGQPGRGNGRPGGNPPPGGGNPPPGGNDDGEFVDSEYDGNDNLDALLRSLEAQLAAASAEEEAARKKLQEAIKNRNTIASRLAANGRKISDVRADLAAKEAEYEKKLADLKERRKHLDNLINAINELNERAKALYGFSEETASKGDRDAYNFAVRGVSTALTAGAGKAFDRVADKVVDNAKKQAEKLGRKFGQEAQDKLRDQVREKLQQDYGDKIEKAIDEGSGALLADNDTVADLTFDVPVVGEVGPGDTGIPGIEAALNFAGAWGNWLGAFGIGKSADSLADQRDAMTAALNRFSNAFNKENEALQNELQKLANEAEALEGQQGQLQSEIAQDNAALIKAEAAVTSARAALARASAKKSGLETRIARVKARIARRNRESSVSPGSNRAKRYARSQGSGRSGNGLTSTYATRLSLNDVPTSFSRRFRRGPLTLWAKGSINGANLGKANADVFGYQIVSGLAWQLNSNLGVGASLGHRRSKRTSSAQNSTFDAKSIFGSSFLAVRLKDQLRLTAFSALEKGSTNVNINGVTGNFDFRVWTFGATLAHRLSLGNGWWVSPSATVSRSLGQRGDYTNSNGIFVASGNSASSKLVFGPTFGKTFRFDPENNPFAVSAITPVIGINGTWIFDAPGDTLLANGTVLPSSRFGATLTGALTTRFANGTNASITGSLGFMDQQVTNWSFGVGAEFTIGSDRQRKAKSYALKRKNAWRVDLSTTDARSAVGKMKLNLGF
ncbi:MAG: autotransporter domain-containing protein [Pseudomonadota bacterium]